MIENPELNNNKFTILKFLINCMMSLFVICSTSPRNMQCSAGINETQGSCGEGANNTKRYHMINDSKIVNLLLLS